MKKIFRLIMFSSILALAAGCQTNAENRASNNSSKPENTLTNSERKTNSASNSNINSAEVKPAESKTPANVAAQNVEKGMTLQAIGNGEKVRLSYQGKSKPVDLEKDYAGDFTAGGDAPHRYTTLLSAKIENALYLVAKFRSGAAISDPDAPCGGDLPSTLLLIKADLNLSVEKVQTEVFDSCIYNGAGRYPQGKPVITKQKVTILLEEGARKYDLIFDVAEADKGLQLIKK